MLERAGLDGLFEFRPADHTAKVPDIPEAGGVLAGGSQALEFGFGLGAGRGFPLLPLAEEGHRSPIATRNGHNLNHRAPVDLSLPTPITGQGLLRLQAVPKNA
jgi:hypothetical protein